MPSETAVPAAELSALTDDKILIIADNVLRRATAYRWNAGGTIASADLSGIVPSKAFDGHLHTRTVWGSTQVADYYLNFTLPANEVYDCLLIKHTGVPASCTLNAQADSDVAWSAPITLHTQTLNSTNRIVQLSLTGAGGSDRRFTDYQHFRLHYTSGAPFAFPSLGQIVLARRRQLSTKAWYPYASTARGREQSEQKARGRARKRHVYAKAFRDPKGFMMLHSGNYGLDDLTTVQELWAECGDGADPVVFIEDPSTAPSLALFCDFQDEELRLEKQDNSRHRWDFNLEECPPFALAES